MCKPWMYMDVVQDKQTVIGGSLLQSQVQTDSFLAKGQLGEMQKKKKKLNC